MRKIFGLVAVSTVAVLTLAACSSDAGGAAADEPSPSVSIAEIPDVVTDSDLISEAPSSPLDTFDTQMTVSVKPGGLFFVPLPRGVDSLDTWAVTFESGAGVAEGGDPTLDPESVSFPPIEGMDFGPVWTAGESEGVSYVSYVAKNLKSNKVQTGVLFVIITSE